MIKNIFVVFGNNECLKSEIATRAVSRLANNSKAVRVETCEAYRNSNPKMKDFLNMISSDKVIEGNNYYMNESLKDMQAKLFDKICDTSFNSYVVLMDNIVSEALMTDDGDFFLALESLDFRVVLLNALNDFDEVEEEKNKLYDSLSLKYVSEVYHFTKGTIKEARLNLGLHNHIIIPKLAKNVMDQLDNGRDHLLFNAIGHISHFQDIQLGSHLKYLEDQGFWKVFDSRKSSKDKVINIR
ncbi:hypothetical protein [Thiomicrorhabdus sp. Milos-T2]|uniref:hypothetical protein n=1 Tax=Thiomicrorhabdus sp. Milos-T2 TaxID=90814 RepID=UPI000494946C|nr:hypothetical protein [Thiomicrorhabdus sp. Milos-T2]